MRRPFIAAAPGWIAFQNARLSCSSPDGADGARYLVASNRGRWIAVPAEKRTEPYRSRLSWPFLRAVQNAQDLNSRNGLRLITRSRVIVTSPVRPIKGCEDNISTGHSILASTRRAARGLSCAIYLICAKRVLRARPSQTMSNRRQGHRLPGWHPRSQNETRRRTPPSHPSAAALALWLVVRGTMRKRPSRTCMRPDYAAAR